MGIFQADKVIFYHPCDNSTEQTQVQDWVETTPVYSAGKVSNGLAPTGGDSIDSFGAETEFRTGAVAYTSVAALSATQFVVVYRDTADSDHGTAKVGTISGTDITFGAETEYTVGTANHNSVAVLSATTFVVVYADGGDSNHGTAKVGTVSGTDITFGAEVEFLSANGAAFISIAMLDSTKFVVAYQDTNDSEHGTAKVGTVSGTNITFGAEAEFLSAGTASSISATALDTTKFVVAYRDYADSNHGTAKVGTVTGTTISFGAEAEFLSASYAGNISVAAFSDTQFVVAYTDGSDSEHGTAKVGTVAGTAITFGAEAEFNSAGNTTTISVAALDTTRFVVAYQDAADAGHGTAKIGTVTGTAIAFSAEAEFLSATEAAWISVAAIGAQFVVAYRDSSDSGNGTAKVGTIPSAASLANQSSPSGFGTESEFLSAGGAEYISAAALSSTKFVVVYTDQSDSNHGTARVGTVSGTDITFGAETEFTSAGGAGYGSIAILSETKFVVVYRDDLDTHSAAKVGTVTGTTIAFGAESEFLSAAGASWLATDAFDATKFVVVYRDGNDSGHGTAKVGAVSGTAITFGAETEFLSTGGGAMFSVTALNATQFVVAYRDDSDSSHGTAKVGTVTGTAITFGAEAEFLSTGSADYNSVTTLSGTRFVVAYSDGADSSHGTAKVGTVSGTAITFGAEAEFLSAGAAVWISITALDSTQFAVAYRDNADSLHGTSKIGTVSGTDITFGAETEFNSAGQTDHISATALSETKFAVAYKDSADSGHGTAKAYGPGIPDPYPTVVSETKIVFCGWFQKPSG